MSDTERPFARVYSRLGNPTTLALERTLLALECGYALKSSSCKKSAPSTSTAATSGAEGDNAQQEPPPVGALVTASGMGAISAVLMSLMTSGDHIICGTGTSKTHLGVSRGDRGLEELCCCPQLLLLGTKPALCGGC